ncbi:hypothetical protein PCAR4_290210 [Paraburkholderia caribensis]|nr:hypothetical protein PCAR4_290210 [Paraburkholderia caribensis]
MFLIKTIKYDSFAFTTKMWHTLARCVFPLVYDALRQMTGDRWGPMFFRLYRIVRSANYSLLVVLIAEYATLAVTTDRAGTSAHS